MNNDIEYIVNRREDPELENILNTEPERIRTYIKNPFSSEYPLYNQFAFVSGLGMMNRLARMIE